MKQAHLGLNTRSTIATADERGYTGIEACQVILADSSLDSLPRGWLLGSLAALAASLSEVVENIERQI